MRPFPKLRRAPVATRISRSRGSVEPPVVAKGYLGEVSEIARWTKVLISLVPQEGLEPPTPSLRIRWSSLRTQLSLTRTPPPPYGNENNDNHQALSSHVSGAIAPREKKHLSDAARMRLFQDTRQSPDLNDRHRQATPLKQRQVACGSRRRHCKIGNRSASVAKTLLIDGRPNNA
jgi:hypothetical protein